MDTNFKKLDNIINEIEDINKEIIIQADKRMTSLAKPLKSLGKLEEIAIKLSGITGKVKNKLTKKIVIIMCSDNGVIEEGVASCHYIRELLSVLFFEFLPPNIHSFLCVHLIIMNTFLFFLRHNRTCNST